MPDQQMVDAYMAKVEESLDSAESDFAAGRYNSCANRCYYACFQAALAGLLKANISPRGERDKWGHRYVRAAFEGLLIERRKTYPSSLRGVLAKTRLLRETADYSPDSVTQKQASRSLRASREFVQAVQVTGGERR